MSEKTERLEQEEVRKQKHRKMNVRVTDFLLPKFPINLGNFVAGHSGEAQRCGVGLKIHETESKFNSRVAWLIAHN